ncbi:MAG TPA: asparaginase domain-containing protein [Salinisphaeraceae bacterium]|nr:asparaginase domain-containing protein [Salinisphaeraceae bacterium]
MYYCGIYLLATGGTLAKRYDARSGRLLVDNARLDALPAELTLPDVSISIGHMLSAVSLGMATDRQAIAATGQTCADAIGVVVIIYGTNTLAETAAAPG